MLQQKVCLIIPCYNEEERLPIKEFLHFFKTPEAANIDALFVNDGSKDDTISVLAKLSQDCKQAQVLDLAENVGKAEAIRQGMLKVKEEDYSYFGYFDADLATPLEETFRLIDQIERHHSPCFIMGSRVKLLGFSDIDRKPARHYIGRVFATAVSNMIKLPIYDTQCGAKLIRKDVVPVIFNEPFTSKWLFDVELLFRIKKNYQDFASQIIEVPLRKWEDKDGSKISLSYYFQAPFDLLRIWLKYK